MDTKIISFWSPVSRSGNSTNAALMFSFIENCIDEMQRAVLISTSTSNNAIEYLLDTDIREGFSSLSFLEQNNELSKEDVLSYTHKISEKIDVLGMNDINLININKSLNMLSLAYDYIFIDVSSEDNEFISYIKDKSDVVIVTFPQDKYICENYINNNILEDKFMILISCFNTKDIFSIEDASIVFNRKVYKIAEMTNIKKACYERSIYNFVSKTKKKKDLDDIFNGIYRVLNGNENIDVFTEKINASRISKTENIELINDDKKEEIEKVIKEYKYIKANNNIALINLTNHAGSTFLALNLAVLIKDKKLDVSIIEPTSNKDLMCMLNIESNADTYNYNGINLYINTWSIDFYNSVIKSSNSINLFDIGSLNIRDNDINYLLNFIDTCIVVIDPLPYKILQSNEHILTIKEELDKKRIDTIYVLNKYTQEVKQKDINKYLSINTITIPFVDQQTIYNAAYKAKPVLKVKNDILFKNSLEKILEKSHISIEKKKSFLNFFSK